MKFRVSVALLIEKNLSVQVEMGKAIKALVFRLKSISCSSNNKEGTLS